jgi:predicted PurR-regulated permease PerM
MIPSPRANPHGSRFQKEQGFVVRQRLDAILLPAAAAAGFVVCILMAAPFLAPLTGALALAILSAPLQKRIELKIRRPALSAALSVLVVGLVVILPAAFVLERLLGQGATVAAYIQSEVQSGALQKGLSNYPQVAPIIDQIDNWIDLPAILAGLAGQFSSIGASFVRTSLVQVIALVLTFYFLFYFLRDRNAALDFVRRMLPLVPEESNHLFGRVADAVEATIYGTLVVAAVQGALGGAMFWALGLPAPAVWGLVMGLLSIVPVLGSFIVWIPAVAFLALNDQWGKAIVLAVWGAAVVGSIDNILRPILVGERLKLHTVVTFISIIGGVIVFGIPGFLLGPMIVTVTIVLVEIRRARQRSHERELLTRDPRSQDASDLRP